MKEIKEQVSAASLLAKKMLNRLSPKEDQALQEWLSKDDNHLLANDILDQDHLEVWRAEIEQVNVATAWDEFSSRMKRIKRKSKRRFIRILKYTTSAAAVLLLAFILHYQHGQYLNREELLSSNTDMNETFVKAELILSDGQVINLEKSKEDLIVEGDILVEHKKGKVNYSLNTISPNVPPLANTLRVPKGGAYEVILSDGTKVCLNSGSELSFSTPFSTTERRVKLKGEAYFDVKHHANTPFIVEVAQQQIQVLGTAFNISAYSDDLSVITTLVEGQVKIMYEAGDQTLTEYLKPNEQSILNIETMDLSKKKVDTQLYTTWKDGRLKFKDESLASLIKKIERWYDVEVLFSDESLKTLRFTGDLPRYPQVANILKILEAEVELKVSIQDEQIILLSK